MPIAIHPICRKPRIHVKLNNFHFRKLGNELLNSEKDAIRQRLIEEKQAKVLLTGVQKETEMRINLSILSRINIRKSLPIFLNI